MHRSQKLSMLRMRSSRLSLLYFLSSLTAATTQVAATMSLLERVAPVCPTSNFEACPNSIPFCCQKGTTCIPLTSDGSSVLCCPPQGGGCGLLQPVSCDLDRQDQSKNPGGLLFTTNSDRELPKCGDRCCPLGYDCEDGTCRQSEAVATRTASPTSATSTPSNTALSSSAAATTAAAVVPTLTADTQPHKADKFPPAAVIVGLLSGLIAGALITFGIIWLLRRRKERKHLESKLDSDYDPSFIGKSPRRATVMSDPFQATPFGSATSNTRTDFIMRANSGKEMAGEVVAAPVDMQSPFKTPEKAVAPLPTTPLNRDKAPVFKQPLKFGLPLNPRPAPERPERPYRSDEKLADRDDSSESQYSARPTYPAEHIAAQDFGRDGTPMKPRPMHTTPPSAGRGTSPGGGRGRVKDDDPVPGINRTNSDQSDSSYITTGSQDSRQRASTETISVGLMPPPLMTENRAGGVNMPALPRQPAERNNVMSTQTTFSAMMEHAGMRKGEGYGGFSPHRR